MRGGGHGVYDLHIVDDSVWDRAIEHRHLGPVVSIEKNGTQRTMPWVACEGVRTGTCIQHWTQRTMTWVACECVRTLDTDDNDMGGI